jgi:hypothetical protein
MRAAQDRLRTKVCGGAERDRSAGDACAFLAARIEPWKTGGNERELCASAVIKRQHIDEWRSLATNLEEFDRRLLASAKLFLGSVSNADKRPRRIALAAVYDDNGATPNQNQLPGGRRADWLASRFKTFFAESGGVLPQPKGWGDTQAAPEGYDLVIVGRMFKKSSIDVPSVEVSWTGYTADGRQVETASGSFPETAAPAPPQSTPPLIPTSVGLYLTMDSDHNGSICAGESTQLWIKSSDALHVRVFDLYGKDGAILIFPADASQSDLVPAHRTVPLGDQKGFEAVPAPGSEQERYLVIAAPSPAGLGRFAVMNRYCRMLASDAAALHRGESMPPGARIAVTGYRLAVGKSCPPPPSADHLRVANEAIARLPICAR